MADENVDISNIIYANNNTKMTLRSKTILDDLANRVQEWNNDSFSVYKSPSKMISENKENISQLIRTPKNRLTIKDPEFIEGLRGSVKKRIAAIESNFVSIKEEPKKYVVPRKKINIPNFLTNADNENDFCLPPYPDENIESITLKDITKENINICTSKVKPTISLKESQYFDVHDISLNVSDDSSPVETATNISLGISDNSSLVKTATNISLDISDNSSPVKTAMNISLGISDNSSPVKTATNISLGISDNSSPVKTTTESFSLYKTCNSKDSESLTDVSFLNYSQEIGLLEEIQNELNTTHYSLKKESFIKPRRSLSFNDKIEIIEPIQQDSVSIVSSENSYSDSDCSSKDDFNFTNISIPSTTTAKSDVDLEIGVLLEEEMVIKHNLNNNLNLLNEILLKPTNRLGDLDHTGCCRNIVVENIRANIIAFKKKNIAIKPSIIEGNVTLTDFDLTVKEGFVCVNLKDISRKRYWKKLKYIYNIIICVYIEDNLNIFCTELITLISKTDADKFKVSKIATSSIRLFNEVHFENVQPKSRLLFDIFCMTASPRRDAMKYKDSNQRNTPIKKLFGKCSSMDKIYEGIKTPESKKIASRCLGFTNVSSFEVALKGLQPNFIELYDKIDVHKDSILAGGVSLQAKMVLRLTKCHEGKLNVYTEQYGGAKKYSKGSWDWYDCRLEVFGISGKPRGGSTLLKDDLSKHVFIPFSWCCSEAHPCDPLVCPKPNTASVSIAPRELNDTVVMSKPINRRFSTDGRNKRRFLFEAPSEEELLLWCKYINQALAAYNKFM